MKDKITIIIMILVILCIFAVLGIFGMIIFEELSILNVSSNEVPNFVTELGENNTIENTNKTIVENIETPDIIENPFNSIESTTNNQTIQYNQVEINKYFYNQLDEYSKIFYNAFEANKENMKTGIYKINFGSAFSELLKQVNGQDLLGKYYQSAIEVYTYDNPDVFYLSPNKMYLNIETITRGKNVTYNVYIDNGQEANYLVDEFQTQEQVEIAIKKIEEQRNNILQSITGNTFRDIKMVHDYLVDNLQYETSVSKPNIYNVYGALINQECVCEGYAKAFKYLLDKMQIPCVIVIGKGVNSQGETESHAWNYVQIEEKWYAIDVTWDDPVIIGGGTASNSSRYKYFLKGADTFNKDHKAVGQFTQNGRTFSYPELCPVEYAY